MSDHLCRQEMVSSYVDGELNFLEARALKAHVGGCTSCRRQMRALAALKLAVRRMPAPPMPADLIQNLLQRATRRRWAAGLVAATVSALVLINLKPRQVRVPFEALLAAHGEYAMTLPLAPRESIYCDLANLVAAREPLNEF